MRRCRFDKLGVYFRPVFLCCRSILRWSIHLKNRRWNGTSLMVVETIWCQECSSIDIELEIKDERQERFFFNLCRKLTHSFHPRSLGGVLNVYFHRKMFFAYRDKIQKQRDRQKIAYRWPRAVNLRDHSLLSYYFNAWKSSSETPQLN